MGRHLADEELMDVLDGVGAAKARRHLEECPRCATRVEEARGGLALARQAEIPEPSPLFWERFRRGVDRRITVGDPLSWKRVFFAPALATAAVLVGVVGFLSLRVSRHEMPSLLPAWSALPPADEDEGLAVLEALAPAADDLGPAGACTGATECLAELSDDESLALAEALRREMSSGRPL